MIICEHCGYGWPTIREPIEYGDEYEIKYLHYPEKEISEIRTKIVNLLNPEDKYSKILDYGCGSGAFVRAARDAGYQAYGYDVNNFTAGIRPTDGYVPEIVTAWDSFEHLTEEQQNKFFEKYRFAKIIILSLPDFETPDKDISLKDWRHYRPGEHLHYYTYTALKILFGRKGYEVVYFSHAEDQIRKAPWGNNILTVGFSR
jgi:SAM-dependent methyltransferase